MTTKKLLIAAVLGLASCTAFAADGWDDLSGPAFNVTVENHSGYTIRNLYMGVNDYGNRNDVLGQGTLPSGYQTTFRARVGQYSIEIIDQDGDHCTVNNIYVGGNRDLVLTNDMLLRCEHYR